MEQKALTITSGLASHFFILTRTPDSKGMAFHIPKVCNFNDFYCTAMLCVVYAMAMCLSVYVSVYLCPCVCQVCVCVSVTSRCSTKMAKHRNTHQHCTGALVF